MPLSPAWVWWQEAGRLMLLGSPVTPHPRLEMATAPQLLGIKVRPPCKSLQLGLLFQLKKHCLAL